MEIISRRATEKKAHRENLCINGTISTELSHIENKHKSAIIIAHLISRKPGHPFEWQPN